MPDGISKRIRYTRQSIVSNTFYQMPRFLAAGEFAGNKLTNNARFLYTLLLDRHRISVKNGWYDANGEVYIYFKREEMEAQLGVTDKTVTKAMQELKNLFLVEEKQQGMNKPNKIYLLSPVIGDDENPALYLDPDSDYNPEKDEDYGLDDGHGETPTSDTENFRPRTRNNSDSEHGDIPSPDTEILRPNDNKLIKNKKKNNNMSDNELSKTSATADTEPPLAAEAAAESHNKADPIPYSQILELYNGLCETHGLRPIKSMNGKRKTQTAARFKEYGFGGFVDLFERVAVSGFLCGGGGRGWKADYDWLTAPTNMQKVLEGKYDDNQNNVPLQQQIYETHQTAGYTYPQQNKQERHDPFLERAMIAYETAVQSATG